MRTDIHKPSVIVPADYDFVAFSPVWRNHADMGIMEQCAAIKEQREIIENHMNRTGGTWSHHDHGGTCHICGVWAIYTVVFYHAKTNTYIKTGQDCANKLEMSYADPNAFRKAVYDFRTAKAGVRKAEAFMADNGLLRALDIIEELHESRKVEQAFFNEHVHDSGFDKIVYDRQRTHNTRWQDAMVIEDVYSKLVKYGSISEKQVSLIRFKVQRHDNYEARMAKYAAEKEAAQPCPTGRVKVTGEVLKTAIYDSQFGSVLKMTVKAEQGFCVFVTVPSAMAEPQRGDKVSFVATLTPSDRDPKFGFGKRPVAA